MANNNKRIQVSELDFDAIKSNLKTFLQGQTEFQDYDFEGSGLSVLLDVLAYNTMFYGYYSNMIANETFLDTAQIENNVIRLTNVLGVLVPNKSCAKSTIVASSSTQI